jgi:hypothetical protein
MPHRHPDIGHATSFFFAPAHAIGIGIGIGTGTGTMGSAALCGCLAVGAAFFEDPLLPSYDNQSIETIPFYLIFQSSRVAVLHSWFPCYHFHRHH